MRGVLFDTSIWIEYFKANPVNFPTCQRLLDERSVWTLDIIFGELVQGAKGKRELEVLDIFYQNTPTIQSSDLPYHAGLLAQKHKLLNQGIGLIDSMIILACLENGLKLWTMDKKIIRFLKADFSSFLYSNL
ncbi:MAG: toxin-antitoxin system COG1487 family toxin component [Algoriphagus marincola HL-49]|uniref:Toxin-antitoxin system COG1487 family toxin component n=1 Tax=Algoriphagus marincola HL-49 TaxID=1305737 RepID=A0A0P8AKR8_9BACT|nr:MAG: toxin-antitoxin system COG1487 family toxin component [Algoriphagus marincola HL-49]